MVGEIHRGIEFPEESTGKTEVPVPYIVLNMVQSTDGRAAIGGKASGLGTRTDRSVMRTLRSKADAVMVGGGTIRAEKLSLSLDTEDTRPVPRAVILTNSGDLPLDRNLVRDPRQEVLVMLPEGADKAVQERLAKHAETRRVPESGIGTIDVEKALEILKSDYGVTVLLCEGGPTLNWALLGADLADELFLTLAPVLVGAGTTGQTERPLHKPVRLISSHVAGDEVFLRYATKARD